MARVKIEVLRVPSTKELYGDDPPFGSYFEPCELYEVGQEFTVEEDGTMPDGFCPYAWIDVQRKLEPLRFGGNFPWMKEEGTAVSCCTDGFRPVIFKLQRIQD